MVGALSLDERPFDALDSLILSQIVYMPMEGKLDKGETCTLAQAWQFLRDNCDYETLDSFEQKRYRLTEICAQQLRYRDWLMHHYLNTIDSDLVMQFCALTFEPPAAGFRYIAFRGTDLSVAGWKEDLNMSFMTIPAQVEAAEYVQHAALKNGDALYLGGHSKGGNLAIYAGSWTDASTRERIRSIWSFDGPGLDENTLLSEGYRMLSGRIESYIPQSSIVGMLLAYHPVYTVVRSHSIGILQHDAMTWQVENGHFVQLENLDLTSKLTDAAIHSWLAQMTLDDRRLLVNTLYHVVDAAQAEQITDLLEDWRESTARILEAIHDLSPDVKKSVRRMLHALFTTGASNALRTVLQGFSKVLP